MLARDLLKIRSKFLNKMQGRQIRISKSIIRLYVKAKINHGCKVHTIGTNFVVKRAGHLCSQLRIWATTALESYSKAVIILRT